MRSRAMRVIGMVLVGALAVPIGQSLAESGDGDITHATVALTSEPGDTVPPSSTTTTTTPGTTTTTSSTTTTSPPTVPTTPPFAPGTFLAGTIVDHLGRPATGTIAADHLSNVLGASVAGAEQAIVDGHFVIGPLPGDVEYQLSWRGPGVGLPLWIARPGGFSAADPDAAGLTIVLPAPASISGTATDPAGRTVDPGTLVHLEDGLLRRRTTTVGPDGSYRFEEVWPGPAGFSSDHRLWVDGTSGIGIPAHRVPAGAVTAGADLVVDLVRPTSSITGSVVAARLPLAGVTVHLTPAGTGWYPWFFVGGTTTGPDGRYSFDHVLPGRYTVWVGRDDVGSSSLPVVIAGPADPPVVVDLAAGRGAISGTLRDEFGNVADGVVVTALPHGGGMTATDRDVDADGSYRLDGLPAGEYDLVVTSGVDGPEIWRHPSPVTLVSDDAVVANVEVQIGLVAESEPVPPPTSPGAGTSGSALLPETG